MRILIVSEGKSELGPNGEDGALTVLTRRMIPREVSFSTKNIRDIAVRRHIFDGIGSGLRKRIEGWIRHAERNDFDALVLVMDRDRDERRIRERNKVQDDDRLALPRALGVAVRSFDAWMLADESAISKALGFSVDTQKHPESNKDPKGDCESLRDQSELDLGLSQLYALIARHAHIDHLKRRCPRGFAPFAERVAAL